MAGQGNVVIGGVDTHKDAHWAAAVTAAGMRVADRRFPADGQGYGEALAWLRSLGELACVGVEGTGSYGAGLCRLLQGAGVEVLEVTGPDRRQRRRRGKHDAEDAYQAAEAALARTRCATAKDRSSDIEGLRPLSVAHDGAVKARTAGLNSLDALVTCADEGVREGLAGMSGMARARACAAWRAPKATAASRRDMDRAAIRSVAKRVVALDREAAAMKAAMEAAVARVAPRTVGLLGVGPQCAARLLLAAGANIGRMGSEASFSMLCGASPLRCSSGASERVRLNRGGDRQANSALYVICLTRMRLDGRTRDFIARKMAEGKSKKEAIRALKRYVAREVFGCLKADLADLGLCAPPSPQPRKGQGAVA